MTELVYLSADTLKDLFKQELQVNSIVIDCEDEERPMMVLAVDEDGEYTGRELDPEECKAVAAKHIRSMGYQAVDLRLFYPWEGLGVVAMVRRE